MEKMPVIGANSSAQTAVDLWDQNKACEDATLLLLDNQDLPAAGDETFHNPTRLQHQERDGFQRVKSSKSRNRWIVVASILLFCIAWGLESSSHGTSRVKAFFSDRKECQDPYAMPGYLLHEDKANTTRWIPYTHNVLHSSAMAAVVPALRNQTAIDDEILALSPPSYAEMLKNRRADPLKDEPDLEFMRDKTILILGCSLDRFAMLSFCNSNGVEMINVKDGWHGMFRCTIPNINLHLQLLFTYGALADNNLPSLKSNNVTTKFETRVRDYLIPTARAANLTTEPDMIIWASGTWDVLGLRKMYAEDQGSWKEQAMSFQEIVWHRRRLHEMIDFLREEYPNVPTLYRPPTYLYKKGIPSHNEFLEGVVNVDDIDQMNEAIYQISQSAEAVMHEVGMPLFRWGDKLVGTGTSQYRDTMHFLPDSYPQWLYAEMMLYYLRYYSMRKPSHCLDSSPGP